MHDIIKHADPRDSRNYEATGTGERQMRFVRNQRWKLYGDGRLIDVKNDVLEENPITSPESSEIRKELQAAMDRMPVEGQSLMKFD